MRSYSSGFRPCCATTSGVIFSVMRPRILAAGPSDFDPPVASTRALAAGGPRRGRDGAGGRPGGRQNSTPSRSSAPIVVPPSLIDPGEVEPAFPTDTAVVAVLRSQRAKPHTPTRTPILPSWLVGTWTATPGRRPRYMSHWSDPDVA